MAPGRGARRRRSRRDRWLDLEISRRRAVARGPRSRTTATLFRQPVTTLDDHLGRGLRVEALRDLVEAFEPRGDDDDAVLDAPDLAFGPPVLRPPSLRDFYAFEGHVAHDVGAARRRGPGGVVPAADLLLQQRLGDPRAGRAGLVAGGLARARLRARGGRPDRHAGGGPAARARRGGDRRLHDLQRLVRPRPPARGDRGPARAGQGQGLRELVRTVARDAGRAGRRAPTGPATTWR